MRLLLCLYLMFSLPAALMAQLEIEPDLIVDAPAGLTSFGSRASLNDHHVVVDNGFVFDAVNGDFVRRLDLTGATGFTQASDSDGFGELVVIGLPRAGGLPSGQTMVFNTVTGEQLHHVTAMDDGPFGRSSRWGSSVSINDKYVAIGDEQAQAVVFDVETGEQIFEYYTEHLNFGLFADVDLHGDLLAIGSPGRSVDGVHDPAILLFNLATGEQLAEITGIDGGRFGANVALSENLLYTQTDDSILAFNHDGDLVNSILSTEIVPGGAQPFYDSIDYSEGTLRLARYLLTDDFDPFFVGQGHGIDVFGNLYAESRFINVGTPRQIAVFTIPEPSLNVHVFAIICVIALARVRVR